VKSLTGKIKVELEWINVENGTTQKGTAEALDVVVAEARTRSASLPPKLRFLEELAQKAFQRFFETHK
jgi:hypothetical protein